MMLSVIIPAHNEEENIADVITRIEDALTMEHELVVVNDHSSDKTVDIVTAQCQSYPNLRLVHNTSAGSFANAIKTGFACARGQALIPVMADLCDDLHTINEMHQKIQAGYDIVCGSRYIKGGKRIGGSRLKGFFSRFVGKSLHFIFGFPTSDMANAFKMYRKQVIDSIDITAVSFEISMEVPLKGYFSGFLMTEVPTVWREREKGKSSFKMFNLLPNYLKLYLWAGYKKIMG